MITEQVNIHRQTDRVKVIVSSVGRSGPPGTSIKFYDTLQEAMSVVPRPENGNTFQVRKETDPDNYGFYVYDSDQPNGYRYLGERWDDEYLTQIENRVDDLETNVISEVDGLSNRVQLAEIEIDNFTSSINQTVNNFQTSVNSDLQQITSEKQVFESEAQDIKDTLANMTTTGKIYDSLADAIAENPKPEDGTPFSVMGDGDNDGYYKFDSTQPDGVKFGRKFDRRLQVESISQLKNYKGRPGEAVDVLGYYEEGDGGGGLFYWDGASTEDDNGGTIIETINSTQGRWKRRVEGAVNVKWFGARGDGVTDDTDAIQKALMYDNVVLPFGVYNSSTLEIHNNIAIEGNGSTLTSPLNTIDHDIVLVSNLNEKASVGSNKISVTNGSSFSVGEKYILQDDVDYEENNLKYPPEQVITIKSISGNTLTLEEELSNEFQVNSTLSSSQFFDKIVIQNLNFHQFSLFHVLELHLNNISTAAYSQINTVEKIILTGNMKNSSLFTPVLWLRGVNNGEIDVTLHGGRAGARIFGCSNITGKIRVYDAQMRAIHMWRCVNVTFTDFLINGDVEYLDENVEVVNFDASTNCHLKNGVIDTKNKGATTDAGGGQVIEFRLSSTDCSVSDSTINVHGHKTAFVWKVATNNCRIYNNKINIFLVDYPYITTHYVSELQGAVNESSLSKDSGVFFNNNTFTFDLEDNTSEIVFIRTSSDFSTINGYYPTISFKDNKIVGFDNATIVYTRLPAVDVVFDNVEIINNAVLNNTGGIIYFIIGSQHIRQLTLLNNYSQEINAMRYPSGSQYQIDRPNIQNATGNRYSFGPTSQRPDGAVLRLGSKYFDTSLLKELYWDGTEFLAIASEEYVDSKVSGASGTFTDPEGKTVTVVDGVITDIS